MAGGGTVQRNKSHKTKFASKSQRAKHKVAGEKGGAQGLGGGAVAPSLRPRPNAKSASQAHSSNARADRVNRSKIVRTQKRAEVLALKRGGGGGGGGSRNTPPRIVLVAGLTASVDVRAIRNLILRSCIGENSGAENLPGKVLGGQQGVEDDSTMAAENEGLTGEELNTEGISFSEFPGSTTVALLKSKQRFTIVEMPCGNFERSLELLKIADIILFATSPSPLAKSDATTSVSAKSGSFIDQWGRRILSVARAQGLPAVAGAVFGNSDAAAPKKRAENKKAAAAAISSEFSDGCQVFTLDSPQECKKLLRNFSDRSLSPPTWRMQRPFLIAHSVQFSADSSDPSSESGHLIVSGFLRQRNISVHQIVHISGFGDFHLNQIDGPPEPLMRKAGQKKKHKERKEVKRKSEEDDDMGEVVEEEMEEVGEGNEGGEGEAVLARANPEKLEPLIFENAPDPLEGDQTWPTEEEMKGADEERRKTKGSKTVKRIKVPKGTSAYQAAWYAGATEEDEEERREDGEKEEEMEEGEGGEEGGEEGEEGEEEWVEVGKHKREEKEKKWDSASVGAKSFFDDDDEEDMTDAPMEEDEEMTMEEREAERKRLKEEFADDQEFPDEVDTPVDVAARVRFAKYRGLKSFRSSPWDPKESLPMEYARIFAFDNVKRTQKLVLEKAAAIDRCGEEGVVPCGTFVRLHITKFPKNKAESVLSSFERLPLVVVGLLQYETRRSVLHFGVKKVDGFNEPVRSKQELLFHVGFRKFHSRPIFSTDDINMDKHKMERFLHPGRFSVASVYAQVSFAPLPLLLFVEDKKESESVSGAGGLTLVGMGSLKGPDPDRVILKKIVLSGYPFSVAKKKAVVRFMFFNPDDVRWFKPIELFTKYGRRGRIREPVGLKGNMKCIFDGVVQQRDAVCLALYKRVYPKWPESV